MYTNQEAFDLVVEKLVAQGKPSVRFYNGGGLACVYRDSDGNRCAAGHLIPDDLIAAACKEGTSWAMVQGLDGFASLVESNSFISALQRAHDEPAVKLGNDSYGERPDLSSWRPLWVVEMKSLAAKYSLNDSKLAELATPEWQNRNPA
jgi:hypothetical protein